MCAAGSIRAMPEAEIPPFHGGIFIVSRKTRHDGEDQKRLTDEKKKRTKKKTKKELVPTEKIKCAAGSIGAMPEAEIPPVSRGIFIVFLNLEHQVAVGGKRPIFRGGHGLHGVYGSS